MLPLILRVAWGVSSMNLLQRGALAAQAKFASSLTTEYVAAAATTSSRIAGHLAKQASNPITLKNLSLASGSEILFPMVKGVVVELSAQVVAYLQTAPEAEIGDVFDHLIDENVPIRSSKELFVLIDQKMNDLSFTESLTQASTVIGVLLKTRSDPGLYKAWTKLNEGVTALTGGYRLMKRGDATSLGVVKNGRVRYHNLDMIQRNPVLYSALFAKKSPGSNVLLQVDKSTEVPLMLRGANPSPIQSNFFVKYAPSESHLKPLMLTEVDNGSNLLSSAEKRVARTRNDYFPFLRSKNALSTDTVNSIESRLVALRDSLDTDGIVPIRRSTPK